MENRLFILLLLETLWFLGLMAQLYDGDDCVTNGVKGQCKIDTECPEALRLLREQRITPTICGFAGKKSIVCCPSAASDLVTSKNNLTERISVKKCEEYKECIQVFHIQVVGGEDAKTSEFPHMAAIGWPLVNGNGYSWNCGGTLVSDKYVLTAAHCTSLESTELSSNTPKMVRLGDLNLNSSINNLHTTDIKISSIRTHPQYRPPSKYHDIALLELERSVIFDAFIKPACLWFSPELPTNTAIATGWGALKYMGSSSDVLQKVTLSISNQDTCRTLHPVNRRLLNSVIEQQLCAGDANGGKDTCQGDSGGPLQIKADFGCAYHVIGVTSFGINCGTKIPAVYTRISSYLDWIENIVWPQS